MAAKPRRHVDTLPSLSSPRPVEMEVLCLGLSRTGTMSLHSALTKLGYAPYHFMEILKPENIRLGHVYAWDEALSAKVDGVGEGFGKREFDKVLGFYSAVTDAPCACFVDELIAAYPNAKVVLGVRNPEKWALSMERSYYQVLGWKTWKLLFPFYPGLRTEFSLINNILRLWTNNDVYNKQALINGYLSHNQHVRDVVPPENLLEFSPDQGWRPLCEFLGKDIPKGEEYPRINEGHMTARLFEGIYWTLVGKVLVKGVIVVGVIGGVVLGWRWRR